MDRGASRLVSGSCAGAPQTPGGLFAAEREPAVQLLARAFRDNPLNVAVIGGGDPARRLRVNAHGLRSLLPTAHAHGCVRDAAPSGGWRRSIGVAGAPIRCRRLRSRGACAARSVRGCAWRVVGRWCSRRSRRCIRPSRTGI
jgi:hypothetical protein